MASIARLSDTVSVYVFVVDSDHTLLRASILQTDATPKILATFSLNITEPITTITALNTSNANIFVVYYTNFDKASLIAGTVDGSSLTFHQPATTVFSVNQTDGALRSTAAVLESWVLVTHGYEGEACIHTPFVVDSNAPTRLRQLSAPGGVFNTIAVGLITSRYLGNGYFVQANAFSARIGQVDFSGNQLNSLQQIEFQHHFYSLSITAINSGLLLFTGVQTLFVDRPLTLAIIVQWQTQSPYLKAYRAENLLSTQEQIPFRFQMSVCYIPSYNQEPYGGIFLSYTDSDTSKPKIIRARVAEVHEHLSLLPSVALDISTTRYTSFLQPLLLCPTAAHHGIVVVQDRTAVFNTFKWAGGFRFAGIPQANRTSNQAVDVTRQGISNNHSGLISGFHYYVFNNGTIAPYTSTSELFTNTGFPYSIGTAISPTQLYLEQDIFDFFG